jgi:CRP-like cAMP-binding protein
VIDRFYRYCRSTGLRLAMPASGVIATDAILLEQKARPPEEALLELIEENTIFSSLAQPEKLKLAQSGREREYRKGDVIALQGQALLSMMIIREGVISMKHHDQEKKRLSTGDFFGETGLLAGMGEVFTLQALTRVTVYEIAQEGFARLLAERPAIATEVAAKLSDRVTEVSELPLARTTHERSATAFLKSIQKIFSN